MRQSKYSQEFKYSTVQLILNDGESVVKVAENLDLNPKTLYHWVTIYKKAHKIPTRSINLSSSKENRYRFRINSMYKVLRVNKSSYYHWIKAGSVIKKVDKKLNDICSRKS
jgi:transposase